MVLRHSGQMAIEAMTLISKALTKMEVGELSILSFGERVRLLHPFDQPFTSNSGPRVLSMFTFNQEKTNVLSLLETAVPLLETQRTRDTRGRFMQVIFIISDGSIQQDREKIQRWIREAFNKHIMLVFIIMDDNPNRLESILEVQSIKRVKKGNKYALVKTSYLDSFPFPYYLVLQDIAHLPEVMADALRQWFELLNQTAP